MAILLHIAASPMQQASSSLRVAEAFIDAYLDVNSSDTVVTINLWEHQLPRFDDQAVAQKYAQIEQLMAGEKPDIDADVWQAVLAEIQTLKAADKLLISTPMWNFSIPYKLKHYFGVVCQPGESFMYDPAKGYFGLLKQKPVSFIVASSGQYPDRFVQEDDGKTSDFAGPYLRHISDFIGLQEHAMLRVQPTSVDKEAALARAIEQAQVAAKTF